MLEEALKIYRSIGDRQREALSLNSLGNAYKNLGQYQRAVESHQQAVAIYRQIGDRKWEANSLYNLGVA